jgi:hypothetical protein
VTEEAALKAVKAHSQALALRIVDRLEYLSAREASRFQHKISAAQRT